MASPKYKYSEMEASMAPALLGKHRKLFLSTFQRERGFPKPTAVSRTVVNVSVRLVSYVSLSGCQEAESTTLEWKLPQGALKIAREDKVFRAAILRSFIEKQILPNCSTHFSQRYHCLSCHGASGITLSIKVLFDVEACRAKMIYLPLCEDVRCRMKVDEAYRVGRKKALKCDPRIMDSEMVACRECLHTVSTLFKCGRCRCRFYCSTACQAAAWERDHRTECQHNFRGRLAKGERQMDVAGMARMGS